MLVLDYLRHTTDFSVEVSPFHSGHLGLIPNRLVHAAFMSHKDDLPSHCEVILTPFAQNTGHLARISCMMVDTPGAVQQLVDSIAYLHLNIVTQESSTVDYSNHHLVNVIVDWTDSAFHQDTGKVFGSSGDPYQQFRGIFPVDEHRYIQLFESIMAHCGDLIHWNDLNLPALRIEPIHTANRTKGFGEIVVERISAEPRSNFVKMRLPDALVHNIKAALRTEQERVWYIPLSDTHEKALRLFFPEPTIIERILHVAIFKSDISGALAGILRLVAGANFNILTSLTRGENRSQSVWEAILEYRGSAHLPDRGGDKATVAKRVCEWFAKSLLQSEGVRFDDRMKGYNLQIGVPRYPNRKDNWNGRITLNDLVGGISQKKATKRVPLSDILAGTITRSDQKSSVNESTTEFLQKLKVRLTHGRVKLFLSYPGYIRDHAAILKDELAKYFDVEEYQDPLGQNLVAEVLDRIERCEVFVGLWHHEDESGGSISPWMPFEYGVARASGKKCIIVHSKHLSNKIWKRISPEIPTPEYTDLTFQSKTVPHIVEHCVSNFLDKEMARRLGDASGEREG